jgi:hypothetical protein
VEATRGVFGDTAANYLTDDQRQVVRAAQIDIIDAALTLGTGAAYTPVQLEGYREAYFPQLGDSEAAIASKRDALRSLLKNAQTKAGRAAPDIAQAIAALDALAKPEKDDEAAGVVPPVQNGGPIPGIREPTQRDIYGGGVEFGMDRWGQDSPFDRARYIQERYGVTEDEEDLITGFWNANSGNGNLTPENVRGWYESKGLDIPADADITRGIEGAKAGKKFAGYDTRDAEAKHNAQLDQVLEQRGADPESMGGAVGVNTTQGVFLGGLDETAGLIGGAGALVRGENPVAGYQVERDLLRREEQRAEQAHPVASAVSEIGGSIPTGGAGFGTAGRLASAAAKSRQLGNVPRATALGRQAVRSSVAPGAATGAAYGYNSGEGLQGSATNALLGGATGAAIAPLATMGGNALARMGGGKRNALATGPTADEVRGLSAETGIPVMTSDVRPPTTFMGKAGQTIGERIPYAGTGGVRAGQQESRREAVENVLRDYGGMNDTAAIDEVMTDLTQQRGAALTRWTGVKDQIKEQLRGATVPTTRLAQAIDRQIATLRSANNKDLNPLIERLSNWRTASQNQGLDNLEELRRDIGGALADQSLAGIRDRTEKVAQALYGPLRDDIGAFIEQAAGKGTAARWAVANRNLSEMAGELKSSRLRNVLNTGDITPENVGNLLFSAKPSEIRTLYNGLSDTGKANARAAIMQHVFGKLGGEADTISPDRFLNVIRTVGKPIGVFFEGADGARVQGLVRALQLTRRAGQANVATQTGQQAIPLLMGISIPLTAGASAVVGGTIGVTARIYESAAVRDALLKLARSKPGSPQEGAMFQRLQGALSRLPASNDNVGGYAAEALSASPQRAAAEQENN